MGICEDAVHLTVKFDEREDGSDLCVNVTWMSLLCGRMKRLAASVSANLPGVTVASSAAPQSHAVASVPRL